MRLMLVGDPHAVPSELEDCQRLVDLLVRNRLAYDYVVFLGDQHHTHGLVHLSVVSFWRNAFTSLGGNDRVIFLVGNHDKELRHAPLPGRTVAEIYQDVATVVTPTFELEGVGFVSHFPDPVDFVATVNRNFCDVATVVCHQTFAGALGDSGFVMPDGVNPDEIHAPAIISGHLHTPQSFGKVWYPGAPRWRTLSDAPVADRAVWIVEFDCGREVSRRSVSTAEVCRAVRSVEDSENSPVDPDSLMPGTDWRVTVVGTSAYVARRKPVFAGRAKVNVRYVRESAPAVRESDGPAKSLRQFLDQFDPPRGTTRERLSRLLEESP